MQLNRLDAGLYMQDCIFQFYRRKQNHLEMSEDELHNHLCGQSYIY